jgi:hypothetical protein
MIRNALETSKAILPEDSVAKDSRHAPFSTAI